MGDAGKGLEVSVCLQLATKGWTWGLRTALIAAEE
jgi:hypothetical protein